MLFLSSFSPGTKSHLRCPQAVPLQEVKVLSSGLNQIKLCPCFHFSEENLFHPTPISLLSPAPFQQQHWNAVCPTIHTDQRTHHSWLIQQETESQAGDSRDQHPTGLFSGLKLCKGLCQQVTPGVVQSLSLLPSLAQTKSFCPTPASAASSAFQASFSPTTPSPAQAFTQQKYDF